MRNRVRSWIAAFASPDMRRTPEWWAGLAFGLAAAMPGVSAIAFGIRPSHILVIAGLVIVAVALVRASALLTWRPGAVEIVGTLFVVASIIVEVFNGAQLGFRPNLISVTLPLLWIASYSAARQLMRAGASLDAFLVTFAAPAVPAALIGIIQALWPAQSTWILALAPSESASLRVDEGLLTRATALVGHWTGLGYYLCTALVALCILLVLRRRDRRGYFSLVFAIILVVGGVVSTLTFAPILTAGAILAVTWFMVGLRAWQAAAFATVTLGLVVGLVLTVPGIQDRLEQQSTASSVAEEPEPIPIPGSNPAPSPNSPAPAVTIPRWLPSTLQWRVYVWATETIPAIGERPASGWGQELYSQLRTPTDERELPGGMRWLSSESQFFWLAVTFGLPVAMAFFLLIGTLIGTTVVAIRRSASSRGPSIVLAAYLLLLVGGSMIVPLFTNRGIPFALWTLAGAVVGAAQYVQTARENRVG